MDRPKINTTSLHTIVACLEQLAIAEESLIGIDIQLLKPDGSPEWRKRAEHARQTIVQKKRIVMARLAILRQQEKVRNVQLHQRHNDLLVEELRQIVTPSSFLRCVQRATEKLESTDE